MKATNKWKQTTNRFVAFFDIMGFKDLVLKKDHEHIVTLLKSLSERRKELGNANNFTIQVGKVKMGESKSFTFSDSIIFFTKGDSPSDLNKILLDCLYMLSQSLKYQIPIKGAISYGKITVDKTNSIYFGQPIIDAFLLHEELQMFSVIADNEFEKRVKETNSKTLKQFKFYKTPLKSGKANHYILQPIDPGKIEMLENLNKLYNTVSGKPRQYIDNTIDFLNSI
jgi:hypothetical protein